MSFSGSNWLGSSGNWTTAADWDDAVPPTGLANNYTATLGGSGNYIVTLNSNVGTIAASGVTASTVGLTLNDVNATLIVASGGTIAVGNANGTGGLVTIDGDLQ
jgi:hypothetical protein